MMVWQQQHDPWQSVTLLKERHGRTKSYLMCLTVIFIVLLFDLLFIEPIEGAIFGKATMSLLALATALGCCALGYSLVKDELEIKLQMQQGGGLQRSKAYSASKELLRRASQECAKYEVLQSSPPIKTAPTPYKQPVYYDPSVPTFNPYYEQTSPPFKPAPPLLNLKPYDYSSDLANSFLRSKGLDRKMRDWVENVRKWFACDLLPLILSGHIENLLALNRLLKHFTANKDRCWIYEGAFDDGTILNLTYEEKTNYRRVGLREIQNLSVEIGCNYETDSRSSQTYSLQEPHNPQREASMLRLSFVELIRQRLVLEKFFEVPDFNCRGYVVSRLHSLSGTSCLSGYSSAAGGSYMSDRWTAKKPTDAHILAHVFIQTLNNGNSPTPNPSFSIYHEIVTKYPNPQPSFTDSSSVCFYQKNPESLIEPHFDVISGREHWMALSGNDNLFSSVALFLHHVRTKCSGYFLKMDCSGFLHLVK
jgi:hypothetical protein